ncbi:hypothetical protein HGM15179_015384 [Zosterops borbonicus]|uniref:Uncharacterized protein n=1 Tax=Zosterops borbonicus TaxID=364589 RepID=A0A8K1LFF7_9PASS|nr:hypothetical protein HGM15179_015384 [Zosterops borbonicus]
MNPSPRKGWKDQVRLENPHLENPNPSQSDQFDASGDARSTGEQEAPGEQHREFQVLQEVGFTWNSTSMGYQELDTCAHLQGSDGGMDPECWKGRN